jgi:hypothetical protein
VKHLTLGMAPVTLPTKIRLGCKGLPRTNALAYYEDLYITEFFYNTGTRWSGHREIKIQNLL